jgi:Tfp pilus assembly protein PilV
MRRARGFSLIELVMIIVLLGIGLTGLMAMFSRSVGSIDDNTGIQTGAQLVQQCAEHILGTRRQNADNNTGYTAATNPAICNGLAPAGFSHTVVVNALAGGVCPAGAVCSQLQITANQGGTALATGQLILVRP